MARPRNKITVKAPLILASVSPRRRQLLRAAGFRFRVVPSHAKEVHSRHLSPSQLVKVLALKKARSVARRHPDAVVLGADTIVFINGHVVGKPRNPGHAVRMLQELSGAWQAVYTGVAVVWAGGKRQRLGVAGSRVLMRRLSEEEIKRASSKHLDKAGAYAVQSKGDRFVQRIVGDYDNVVGLPLRVVRKLLRGADFLS